MVDSKNNELYHWLKLGEQAKKHKYVARVTVGTIKGKPQYRYFYTKWAYDIYLKNQKKKEELAKKSPSNNGLFSKLSRAFTSSTSKLNVFVKKAAITATKKVSEVAKSPIVTKGKAAVTKVTKTISAKAVSEVAKSPAVVKGKKVVEKAVKEVTTKAKKSTIKEKIQNGLESAAKTIAKIGNKSIKAITSPTDDYKKAESDYEDAYREYKSKEREYSKYVNEKGESIRIGDDSASGDEKYYTKTEKWFIDKAKHEIEGAKDLVAKGSLFLAGFGGTLLNKPLRDILEEKITDSAEEVLKEIRDKGETKSDIENKLSGMRTSFESAYGKAVETYEKYRKHIEDQVKRKNPKSFDDLKKSSKKYTAEEDADRVNPYFDEGGTRWTTNCAYCTATYELRRRGYDVEADSSYLDSGKEGTDIYEIIKWYDGVKEANALEIMYANSKYEKDGDLAKYIERTAKGVTAHNVTRNSYESVTSRVKRDLAKQGNGARGQFMVQWANGGGHSVAYEVIGNKVILRDTQTNDIVSLESYIGRSSLVYYFRTDDKELEKDILKCVKNKTEDTVSDRNDYYD